MNNQNQFYFGQQQQMNQQQKWMQQPSGNEVFNKFNQQVTPPNQQNFSPYKQNQQIGGNAYQNNYASQQQFQQTMMNNRYAQNNLGRGDVSQNFSNFPPIEVSSNVFVPGKQMEPPSQAVILQEFNQVIQSDAQPQFQYQQQQQQFQYSMQQQKQEFKRKVSVKLTNAQKDNIQQFREFSNAPAFLNSTKEIILHEFLNGFDGGQQQQQEANPENDPEANLHFQTGMQYQVMPATCKRLRNIFKNNHNMIRAFLVEMAPNMELDMEEKQTRSLFPNSSVHPDYDKFWSQDIIQMFLFENWNEKSSVDVAGQYQIQAKIKKQDEIINQLSQQIDHIQNEQILGEILSKIDQFNLEKEKLLMQINNQDIFSIVNDNPDKLKYEIDLHFLKVKEAKSKFQECYLKTLCDLRMGQLENNTSFKHNHIIKVICGYGHGRQENQGLGLKEAFLEYFTENLYDFVYIPEHGTFLVRVKF